MDRPLWAQEQIMNYKQSGGAKPSKGAPKFDAHKTPAAGKGALGAEASKTALLARMKAAASKTKAD